MGSRLLDVSGFSKLNSKMMVLWIVIKARLVAKGYTQVEGVDYTERFSPVAKAVTVRLFLAIGTAKQWPIHQIDITNAFLHGHLDEEIFMTAPEGYDVPPGHVCKLIHSLYGLKQASRQWNLEFTRSLLSFGFLQSMHDHCFFLKKVSSGYVGLLVYVDDVLIMAPSEDFIAEIKTYLDGLFTIKNLGMSRYFLGLQIARSALGTSVTQSKYISDIITDCGLTNSKSVVTPLPQGVKLHSASDAFLSDPEPYRRLVGRLLYLGFTRPDISHGVQQLSQFLQKPCQAHWHAALHMVRYLKGSSTQGLFFPSSNSSVFELTVMRIGVHVLILVVPSLVSVRFLVMHSFPGKLKNNVLFRDPLLRPSIGV
ncbi:UNVERIFIED_CONTAM: putative transposon Ty5-1 protein [Sesamum radiatum]|uniref:Transposon Ty5-1 protein n=1 Tax=Sesamum radiatum TaxID=300843 RepID=A0AAW2T471_SESRA